MDTLITPNEINAGALISRDGKYRYRLWRIWDDSKPLVLWIMLNPSTADHAVNDPTITRCIGFTRTWGYGGLYVGNLFAYRATDPSELKLQSDPYGPDNFHHVWDMIKLCGLIICAWGNYSRANGNLYQLSLLRKMYCVGTNKNGSPKHPLYLKADSALSEYRI
jgi:hypothetical protein